MSEKTSGTAREPQALGGTAGFLRGTEQHLGEVSGADLPPSCPVQMYSWLGTWRWPHQTPSWGSWKQAASSSFARGSLSPQLSGGLKAQPLTSRKQMGRTGVPAGSRSPGGSRVGIRLPRTPIPAALKQRICNLYEASEIGALWVCAKLRRPSAPLSLCFPPKSLPADPI